MTDLVLVKEGGGTLPVTLRKYQVVGRGGERDMRSLSEDVSAA